jgi:Ca2+/H+ antiporter, TMEM165/GDT1 family
LNWLAALSTFLASGVEWVEALTIVLAVAVVRGWRPALTGAGAAAVVLLGIVAVFGTAVSVVPLEWAQGVIGVLLLLFGLRWLRKAVLRAAGRKALHDEAKEFAETTAELSRGERREAVVTAFTGVLLEGIEVVFIVVALGGVGNKVAASVGALTALAAVVALGIAARRPLTRVPENAMKFAVGVMVTSFGVFLVGEAIDLPWWHADLSLVLIVAALAAAALVTVRAIRTPRLAA